MRLFLDDERFPPGDGDGWAVARSYEEAVDWVEANGFPGYVSFDNDLGEGRREGWEFAQWLIDRDLDSGGMPDGFEFYAHSRNPVRAEDITARLRRYLDYRARGAPAMEREEAMSEFGVYVHGDSVTRNKGAAIAVVSGGPGFAAAAARLCYAASAARGEDAGAAFPEAEAERKALGAAVGAISVVRLGPREAGRVEAAVSGSGAALAKVLCDTDFGARTPGFIAFAGRVAEDAARGGVPGTGGAASPDPGIEDGRIALSRELRENVRVAEVVALLI